jgi:hypothetical protein
MSSQGNGQSKRYSVHGSKQTKAVLDQLHQQAVEAGIGQQFAAALRQIGNRLQADPLALGEPLYRLPALKLLVCQAVILPLVVNFAVHDELPLVFIRGFKVLS